MHGNVTIKGSGWQLIWFVLLVVSTLISVSVVFTVLFDLGDQPSTEITATVATDGWQTLFPVYFVNIISFVGFVITSAFSWWRQLREDRLASLELHRKQLELERERLLLAKESQTSDTRRADLDLKRDELEIERLKLQIEIERQTLVDTAKIQKLRELELAEREIEVERARFQLEKERAAVRRDRQAQEAAGDDASSES
jgi:hypothetical protein